MLVFSLPRNLSHHLFLLVMRECLLPLRKAQVRKVGIVMVAGIEEHVEEICGQSETLLH